jgi:LDH2 family malate/lactate/ureidoglycolate dehydrogenase
MEAEMRATMATLAGLVALITVSAQAALVAPAKSAATELTAPPIELATPRQGARKRRIPGVD